MGGQAGDDNGFTDVKHVIELFGLCANCSASRADPSIPTAEPGLAVPTPRHTR